MDSKFRLVTNGKVYRIEKRGYHYPVGFCWVPLWGKYSEESGLAKLASLRQKEADETFLPVAE